MSISHRTALRTAAVLTLAVAPSLLPAGLTTAAVGAGAPPSVTVRYGDLDLNGPEGIAALYGRIRGAAGEVCRPLESRELARKSHWSECVDHAVADAVNAVHNRTLSAYHGQRSRVPKQRGIESPTTVASR